VIKDAGDDPDVTHGLEIQATVSWGEVPGITLKGGEGVGMVTKPGLPIPVGEPAINPVPRRLIVGAVVAEAGRRIDERGLAVTIRVPGGEEVAKQTMNPKLGILGGISILGTSGIVKPFSASAYRASIYIELKMAAHNGVRHAVLTTGKRSETYAQGRYPDLPEYSFVQVGDHIDYGLKQVRRLRFERVTLSSMIGKVSKLAQGRMQTHVSRGEVDLVFLAGMAAGLGADDTLCKRIREANTAHHVQVMLQHAGITDLEARLAEMAAVEAESFINGTVPVEVLLWHIKGELLALGSGS
jgi:cobalt-precorrin-5B (C1)-methyltransferase